MARQIIVPRPLARSALTSPLEIPGTAAWYSLEGPAGDASYIKDGSNRVQLTADRSGNWNTNGLVLNATSGNYATTPDAAPLRITGDIDLRVNSAAVSWNTGSAYSLVTKSNASRLYELNVNSSGKPYLDINGAFDVTATSALTSYGFLDGVAMWLRVTRVSSTGVVTFYRSADGVNWTQLDQITATSGAINTSAQPVNLGQLGNGSQYFAGIIYRAQIYNGIGGTLVFDANFANVAKLATSFTESSSNAATVTINTTAGATGARICGARDRVQLTQTRQAIWSAPGYATYDGTDDYDKSAPFALSQPFIRYTAFKHITWTSGDILWDGNAAGSAKLTQTGSTPNLQMNAGSAGAQRSTFVLDTWAVCVEEFNGAGSTLQRNADASVTADAGSTAANGVTIGADGAGNNAANIAVAERITWSGTHSAYTKARVIDYLFRKRGIPRP